MILTLSIPFPLRGWNKHTDGRKLELESVKEEEGNVLGNRENDIQGPGYLGHYGQLFAILTQICYKL